MPRNPAGPLHRLRKDHGQDGSASGARSTLSVLVRKERRFRSTRVVGFHVRESGRVQLGGKAMAAPTRAWWSPTGTRSQKAATLCENTLAAGGGVILELHVLPSLGSGHCLTPIAVSLEVLGDKPLVPGAIQRLRANLSEGPRTYGHPGSTNYRFFTDDSAILIMDGEGLRGGGVDWYLMAKTDAALERLIQLVSRIGTVVRRLQSFDERSQAILDRVRYGTYRMITAIARAAPERLRVVHLFGFRRRDDEVAGRRGARNVRVAVNAVPEQRRERFDALVAQVLVLVPGPRPPPRTTRAPRAPSARAPRRAPASSGRRRDRAEWTRWLRARDSAARSRRAADRRARRGSGAPARPS